ncbi:hypothetical protein QN277_001278 [Acacia crassicarpa]|uniref:MADS-box domain-containing protein n=1 Tax=Acacia crassicarpa TaxID=499986 RepID=A0AAE1N9F0_9FABA|nr:hypothetical protein QN277_001278 [Acacia crassicarpa]
MSSISNNGGGGGRRRSKGRQKIEIKKMENESNLQVTFSKRRAGLFKKASELCTLCGVEVAIIVFSPGEKAYSFGHPSVDTVLDRFLNGGVPLVPPSASMQMMEAHRLAVQELNAQLTDLLEELEVEKKIGKELNKKMKEMETDFWLAQPVGTQSKDQLGIYKARLEEMKKTVWSRADQIMAYHIGNNSSQFFVGGSSSSSSAAGFQMPPPPLLMQNTAGPPPAEDQVCPPPPVQPPPVLLQQQPREVQNPMMFDGNMILNMIHKS